MRTNLPLLLAVLCLVVLAATPASADEGGGVPTLSDWPHELADDHGVRLVMHEPQVDRWANDVLEARIAVVLHFPDEEAPVYGALWVRGETRANLDTRIVTVANLRIVEARFPSTGAHQQGELVDRLERLFPKGPMDMALDRLLADVERVEAQAQAQATGLGSLEPRIVVETVPARLVLVDGDPALDEIPGTGLLHVVNTDWHVLLERATGTWFLRLADGWMTTADLSTDDWSRATRAPRDLARIPDGHPRSESRHTPVAPHAPAPRIHVSTVPAELVVMEGAARFSPIPGTSLLYVTNTSADVFLHVRESLHYLLVSGRWYRAARLSGPWEPVLADLPGDFARIPTNHAKGRVLVSVPGTPAAEEAVLLAQIPRRVVIRRDQPRLEVRYVGLPHFVRCPDADVSYAINTAYDVLLAGGRYYCCHQGVWFVAEAALGPWLVCDAVPTVIYTISPRCPVYRVTFVRVYDATPKLVVVGYLPGYLGLYVCPRRRVVVFGTGWWYRPWIGAGTWFGWPLTFGVGVVYHPYVASYVVGVRYYTPLAVRPIRATWYSSTARYYSRYDTTNLYAHWGPDVIHDHAAWLRRSHVTGVRGPIDGFGAGTPPTPPPTPRPRRTSPGTPLLPQGPSASPLYVGPDGRIYRRSTSGWQSLDGSTWRSLPTAPRTRPAVPRTTVFPTDLHTELERAARSRQIATQRMELLEQWRRQQLPLERIPRVAPPSQPRSLQPRSSPPPVVRSGGGTSAGGGSGGGGGRRR
ncbi:MAG: hypothetical protein AB7T63_12345 [Planctomycetota bacterium]